MAPTREKLHLPTYLNNFCQISTHVTFAIQQAEILLSQYHQAIDFGFAFIKIRSRPIKSCARQTQKLRFLNCARQYLCCDVLRE